MRPGLVRVAGTAVLLSALAFGMRATAAPLSPVHLEPQRVFNPASESMLRSFAAEIGSMSIVAQSVFHLEPAAASMESELADMLVTQPGPQIAQINLNGVSTVQRYAPQIVPSPISAPQLSAPENSALSAQTQTAPSPAGLPPPGVPALSPVRFGSYESYSPALQSLGANVRVPVRVGNVHFNGVMSGQQAQSLQSDAFREMQICGTTDENAACPYLRDTTSQSFVAGTDFNVRAGSRDVNLQLAGTVSRLSSGDAAIFPYIPVDPDAQLSNNYNAAGPDADVLQYPGLADVVKHGVGASLAVPVTNRITLGLQYDRSHYQGDYGNTLLPGVDAYKNTYLGNVSYQLPNSNSMLTLSARQYRYQDTFSPNFNLTQTRADLNFTVKF